MNDANAPASGPTRRRRGRYIGIALIVVALLVAAGLWATTYFGRQAVEAQRRYHAVVCACELIAVHVERSGGKDWPRSWDDFDALPARDFNSFAWPRDKELLSALVEIDFAATVGSVLAQSPESFTAVRPAPGQEVFPAAAIYESLQGRVRRAAGR